MTLAKTEVFFMDNYCIPYEEVIKPDTLAFAYVPMQQSCPTYEALEGTLKGTMFPGLYSYYK
jgi:hypothetical protein